ncbi:hypothetical protein [Rothia nasimurium]|uniref:hypothetical protein n=1 Tax=Rothia nasimurium TaxID=85336 RepID=UPI002DD6BA4A|nr:hypothetical protein [Rothia nasimurium]
MSFAPLGQIPPRIFYTVAGAPILCPPGYKTDHDAAISATFTSFPLHFIGAAPLGDEPLADCETIVQADTGAISYSLNVCLEEVSLEEIQEAAAQVVQAAAWCAAQTKDERTRRAALQENLAAAGLLKPTTQTTTADKDTHQ